jgi:hypothetical protein
VVKGFGAVGAVTLGVGTEADVVDAAEATDPAAADATEDGTAILLMALEVELA